MKFTYAAFILLLLFGFSLPDASAKHRHDRCELQGFVGVTHSSPSRDKVKRLGYDVYGGTLITNVIGCTGAEAAGLQPLDYLVAVDGKEVDNKDGFFCLLSDVEVGETVKIDYFRKGQRASTNLTLGRRSESCQDRTVFERQGFFGLNDGDTDAKPGVVVDVSSRGPLADMGVEDGDRILRINGYPIGDWHDVSTVKRLITDLDNVTIETVRDGQDLTFTGGIDRSQSSSYTMRNSSKDCEDCDNCNRSIVRINGRAIEDEINQALAEVDFDDIEREIEEAIREADIEQTTTSAVETAMEAVREALSRVRNMDNDDYSRRDVDPTDMTAELSEVSSEDVERMEREDVDMPRLSNLELADFAASPNPSDGRFRLNFTFPGEGAKSVAIYSATGREVYSYELSPDTRQFADELDVMRNGPGNYFLVVRQGSQAFTKKLVFVRR